MTKGFGMLLSAFLCGMMILASSCYKGDDYIVTIRKGDHSHDRFPYVWINKKKMELDVTFTESCRYDIGIDQGDHNKLFGIGYSPGHRMNSIRFGWYYNPSMDCIVVTAYVYNNGQRFMCDMANISIGEINRYSILIDGDKHVLNIEGKANMVVATNASAFSYMLHPYFGGNQPAPHDIRIKMTRP